MAMLGAALVWWEGQMHRGADGGCYTCAPPPGAHQLCATNVQGPCATHSGHMSGTSMQRQAATSMQWQQRQA